MFFLVKPPTGTGTIDASQVTGNVFILVNDAVQTVKLGDGPAAVMGRNSNTAPKTYVLNPIPLVGSFNRPFIGLRAGDTIDARGVIGDPTWVFNNLEQSTFDNKAATGSPYLAFSAFSRYQAFDTAGNRVAEFAGMLLSSQAVADPAAVVRDAVIDAVPSISASGEVSPLLHYTTANDGVKGRLKNLTGHAVVVDFRYLGGPSRTLAPGEEVTYYGGQYAWFQFRHPDSSHAVAYQITDHVSWDPRTSFRPDINSLHEQTRRGWDENESHDEKWGGTFLRVKREKDGWNGGYETSGSSDWAVFTIELFGI